MSRTRTHEPPDDPSEAPGSAPQAFPFGEGHSTRLPLSGNRSGAQDPQAASTAQTLRPLRMPAARRRARSAR
jgi:hypothetical protein